MNHESIIEAPDKLKIVEYEPSLKKYFYSINEEWITEMFAMEEKDRRVLEDPQREIIDQGGRILFISTPNLGIIGTGALLKTGPHQYELTKMGVLKSARGLKTGAFLLRALIERAYELTATNLYLMTNKKCEAAIHLYEKHGFKHDPEIMAQFGWQYERCDVAMRHFI